MRRAILKCERCRSCKHRSTRERRGSCNRPADSQNAGDIDGCVNVDRRSVDLELGCRREGVLREADARDNSFADGVLPGNEGHPSVRVITARVQHKGASSRQRADNTVPGRGSIDARIRARGRKCRLRGAEQADGAVAGKHVTRHGQHAVHVERRGVELDLVDRRSGPAVNSQSGGPDRIDVGSRLDRERREAARRGGGDAPQFLVGIGARDAKPKDRGIRRRELNGRAGVGRLNEQNISQLVERPNDELLRVDVGPQHQRGSSAVAALHESPRAVGVKQQQRVAVSKVAIANGEDTINSNRRRKIRRAVEIENTVDFELGSVDPHKVNRRARTVDEEGSNVRQSVVANRRNIEPFSISIDVPKLVIRRRIRLEQAEPRESVIQKHRNRA